MKFVRFYWVNTIMSAFTLLEAIAGATFLVAAAVSVLLWIRKPAGVVRLTVFDQLLDRVHARRTEIFATHRSPPGTIQAREELLAETRLRLRREKSFFSERHTPDIAAFTLIELLVVIVVIAVCVGILLPWLMRGKSRAARITCVNQMRAVGSGCRLLASDLGGKFSTQVSTNDGGSLEFVEGANAFRHFQAMSNELCTPKILLCPEDRSRARAATNWMADFDNSKLSYFLGLDLTETNVLAFLVGDRNITNGLTAKNGTLLLATNQAVGWTKQIHRKEGNICFVDGSVRQFTSAALGQALRSSGLATNRLAIP